MTSSSITDTKTSVSVVVPSLNEALNITNTINTVLEAAKSTQTDVEIIVVNDGSQDDTGPIADKAAKTDSRIIVLHNDTPTGLGSSYSKGVRAASKEYVTMIPGDDETPIETVSKIMESSKDVDLVLTYIVNTEVRAWSRRIPSKLFVWLVRIISGHRAKYFNGNNSLRREILKSIPMESSGHIYMALTVVRLLNHGCNHKEVGVWLQPRGSGATNAFKIKSVLVVALGLMKIFKESRLGNKR